MKYIFYFYRPQLVDQLWKLEMAEGDDPNQVRKICTQVVAAGQFSYAVMGDQKEVYSWGMGENYVLGNRDDCNQFTPYLLDPRMFEENPVVMMACGTQHSVALSKAGADAVMPEIDKTKFVEVKVPKSPVAAKKTPKVAETKPETTEVSKNVGDDVASVKSIGSAASKKRSHREFAEGQPEQAEIGSAVKKLKIEEKLETIAEAD